MTIVKRDAQGRIAPGAHASADLRFWAKVNKDGPCPVGRPDLGPCWVWTGGINPRGYGNFWPTRAKSKGAHAWAYEDRMGAVPMGYELDHLCRNRACVNPAHLERVTRQTNQLRGESVSGRAARMTHCPQGHPYDEQNTAYWSGHRRCRACNAEALRKRQAAVYVAKVEHSSKGRVTRPATTTERGN